MGGSTEFTQILVVDVFVFVSVKNDVIKGGGLLCVFLGGHIDLQTS